MEEREQPELKQAEQELHDLLRRCKAGDRTVQPQLAEFLDRRPDVWQRLGDLAHHLQEAILDLAAGPDLATRELIRCKLEDTKTELAGPSPSLVRRLLAERVALSAAIAYLADLAAVQADKATGKQATRLRRRQEATTKLYLEGLRLLHSFDRTMRRAAPQPKLPSKELPATSSPQEKNEDRNTELRLRVAV